MAGRPYVLSEMTWQQVQKSSYDVALLPWGATEAHNYHLPYGTDAFESQDIANEAARIASERGANVVALPVIPFGVNTGQLDIPLTINMNPSTQFAVLADIVESLDGQGISKLVIVNSHGGNDFKQMIRELQPATDLLIATINWWTILDGKQYFDEPGDHAGELETSFMMHLHNELLAPLNEAGPGASRPMKVAAFREGWAWTPRAWLRATSDTGVGNPSRATAEKGKRFFSDVTEKIAGFLVELAATPASSIYEGEE
jgi:creatinine amidohydrolase